MPSFSEKEQSILRLVLTGQSPIDRPRLFLGSAEEAKHLLSINEFHSDHPKDVERLRGIHNESVNYLTSHLQMTLPPEIVRPDAIEDLLLIASQGESTPKKRHACALLKVMNLVNFIDGQELLFNSPISGRDLVGLVEDKIERELSGWARKELPRIRYQGGRKPKESVITRLFSKTGLTNALRNERVRYQVVVPTLPDILTVVLRLFDTILPYNYLIPASSVNQLFDSGTLKPLDAESDSKISPLRPDVRIPERKFSGPTYRILKFAAHVPVRLDNSPLTRRPQTESLGTRIYVRADFQIIDEETEHWNAQGDNAHPRYKGRQKSSVTRRLMGEP